MARIRVRLECAGLRLAYEGERARFERLVAPLLLPLTEGAPGGRTARTLPAPPAAPAEVARPAYAPPSDRFGTFQRQLAQDGERDHGELVAAYAFFLWNYEKREVFTEDEVAGCFAAHGHTQPEDPAGVYGDLLSQRVLAPGAAQNTWRLTSKGRDFVRHHLLSA